MRLDVLLPFAGVIIGVVAGLLGSWLRLRWQGRAQWQRLLHEAAAEYAAKLAGASTAVRHAISSFEKVAGQVDLLNSEQGKTIESAIKDAAWYINEIPLPLSRLQLLFGEDSRVFGEARAAKENLEQAIGQLREYRDKGRTSWGLENAQKLHEEAEKAGGRFLSSANSEIRKAV